MIRFLSDFDFVVSSCLRDTEREQHGEAEQDTLISHSDTSFQFECCGSIFSVIITVEQKGNASNHRDKHGSPHEERESVIKRAGDTIDRYPNSDKKVEKRHGENLLSLSSGYMKKGLYQHER